MRPQILAQTDITKALADPSFVQRFPQFKACVPVPTAIPTKHCGVCGRGRQAEQTAASFVSVFSTLSGDALSGVKQYLGKESILVVVRGPHGGSSVKVV